MRLFRRSAVYVVFLLVAVVATVVLRMRGPLVTTTRAARTDIEQHVVASGRVRVVTRVQLSAEVGGRVVAVSGVEGQRVRSGDLLVQLDDTEARAAVAQAQAAVKQASGRIEQLRKVGAVVTEEASRQTATALARAEAELARVEELFAGGLVARADLDDARRNVDIERARMNAAEAQKRAAAPEGVDSALAASALVESQARLAAARARLAQTRLLAPQDGVILRRSVEPGYAVQPGTDLLEIAADGETELVIEPDERNLAWIRLGQQARASADTYPDEIFDAEVSYVAPAVDPRRGSIEVRLRVPVPPAFLKPDMTVSVDLTVAVKRQVIAVPSTAVRSTGTDGPWVAVVEDGRIARRSVTLGIQGEGHTEVEAGLEEGAEVVTAPGAPLAPGEHVRVERGAR